MRRSLVVLFATIVLFFSAGCGGGGNAATADEMSDPLYQEAQDLKKQGRYAEALSAFLKVIDRRGDSGSPESHLEAGTLCLKYTRDPVAAYYHFSRYLELRPVGTQSQIVAGQREAALRAFLAMSLKSEAPDLMRGASDDVEQLRRRVQELEAENQTLRGSSSVPVVRQTPMISIPTERAPAEIVPSEIPVIPATPRNETGFVQGLGSPSGAVAPAASPASNPAASATRPVSRGNTNAAVAARPAASGERVVTTPTRPGSTRAPSSAGGRSHTVGTADKSLWSIARRYYGAQPTAAQVQGIYLANRDTMKNQNDLRAGMVLRIP